VATVQAELPGVDEVRPVHPVADLFPMMSDEELDDLAADIKANGLVHPIVIDREGTLIDGRNRLEACRRAKVEAEWTVFDGDDPVAFILSSNVNRRHMTPSQRAMVVARASRFTSETVRGLAQEHRLALRYVSHANVVLRHAPDLADAVTSGATSLDDAYRTATDRKRAAESTQEQMAYLRSVAPDLADLVVEERISLATALGELRQRTEKARQYRELTTRQLESALSFLDPRQIGAAELAAQMAENVDPSALSTRPDVSPERIRACAAVLTTLADAMRGKES
jgi:ParB-like chromosome segregation protein Spo0J